MQKTWKPFPAQIPFLASSATEALYGGAAGGGKTDALVLGALRFVGEPQYNGIIFRRLYPELEQKVIPVSMDWYPAAGGVYDSSKHTWRFPSGARIKFAHMQHEKDLLQYQGGEYQYVAFDELTHFAERQYLYLFSRMRTTAGIPRMMRAGTNPGGPGHEWVQKRWAAWLDRSEGYDGPMAKPGEVLRYNTTKQGAVWAADGKRSRVFFPARSTDNPYLNTDYTDNIMELDRVSRAQLIDGDWMIRPAAGAYFQRGWFRMVDIAPADVAFRVRSWDLASTEGGGDWTTGVLMALTNDGQYVIEDVVRGQWRPEGVQRTVRATAELDGIRVRIELPQDPGQAGKDQMANYAKMLAGYNVRSKPVTGDKVTRAQPFSAQAEAGNVLIKRARWNNAYVEELEAFPEDGMPDDQVDASSGGFNALCKNPVVLGDPVWKRPGYTFGNSDTGGADDW